MINIPAEWLNEVKLILIKYIPSSTEIRVFGSRITNNVKKYSDLDLALMNEKPMDLLVFAKLKDALKESNVPIKVDVIDWASTEDAFKKMINQKFEILTLTGT